MQRVAGSLAASSAGPMKTMSGQPPNSAMNACISLWLGVTRPVTSLDTFAEVPKMTSPPIRYSSSSTRMLDGQPPSGQHDLHRPYPPVPRRQVVGIVSVAGPRIPIGPRPTSASRAPTTAPRSRPPGSSDQSNIRVSRSGVVTTLPGCSSGLPFARLMRRNAERAGRDPMTQKLPNH